MIRIANRVQSVALRTRALGLIRLALAWVALAALSLYAAPPVTVPAPAQSLRSLSVTPANAVIALGAQQQFTAIGTYSSGTTQDLTNTVSWTSSAPAVASVSPAGLAVSTGQGATTITASLNGVAGAAGLTVTAP